MLLCFKSALIIMVTSLDSCEQCLHDNTYSEILKALLCFGKVGVKNCNTLVGLS